MHSQTFGELTMVLVTVMNKIVNINTYNHCEYTPPICKTDQIAEIHNKDIHIQLFIHKKHLQLLQFILTLHLHPHHHIHAFLLGDKQLRNKPEVISILVEAHRRPLIPR